MVTVVYSKCLTFVYVQAVRKKIGADFLGEIKAII